ncbi:ATP-dependent DNA ligase [Nitrospira moscoviensis]|uniref:Probable DNA ligase n=1 Tax=Nitrospira moscoviensis TaxID=42253 RepID=A0A0K2GHU0_NITMO|nr:ATP-dependent DNA ligase [Nitrospira moscoviensis]ALA60496.1 putative DNA ligase [Nitrospira moscoviensis]
MQLARLVEVVGRVRATAKKSEKVSLLAEVLREARGRGMELAALYLTGSLSQGRIGIGWSMIQKALTGAPAIGEPLALADVDGALERLAEEQGAGSTERRVEALRRLFGRATPEERRFLSQLLVGEIRQGALEGVLLDAIAKAAHLPPADVRQASMFAPDIGALARVALEEGSPGLRRFSLTLFKPVAPMLASSAEDVDEALGRLDGAAWEYKLDGARIQVHKGGDEVRVFTRQLQDVTDRLPEIVDWARTLPAREAVLDGEALGLRPDGRPQPFQITMRRLGRQKDVAALQLEIPLSPFLFDALALDGASLLSEPYRERTRALRDLAPSVMVPRVETRDANEVRRFFHAALDAGHEGVMAKSLTAPYSAGQRGFHWLKLKEAVTLDLVILAAEWGNGRREGWLSNLHLGARDPESGRFVMLGKTFKGLTDEMLRWQTAKLLALETHRDAYTVFVRPELVAEIAFSDIQESPRYPAGLALRFARVKRYRPDKPVDQADTIQTVAALFQAQRT